MKTNYHSAIGKRKTSVAKVILKEGSGVITVNKKSLEEFFAGASDDREIIKNPLALLNLTNQYDIFVVVKGGGVSSQLDAIKLAIAKSLLQMNNDYRTLLSQSLLLRRDSRIKERRKYGLKKARKGSQYSKR